MKFLWVDLEMSGLDVEKERIIEVAAIVTDENWQELAKYHQVVKQEQKYIDGMDDWNKEHHGKSGLIDKIPSGKPDSEVESELVQFIEKEFAGEKEKPILAGNSIHQDRKFIDKYWPKFAETLHYRMLDVSSWKVIFKEIYGKTPEKRNTHEALEDIRESIMELKFYTNFLDKEKLGI